MFTGKDKELFERAYASAIVPYYILLKEIYDEVFSGNEIRSVVMAGTRLKNFGWTKIDDTRMWKVGEIVRASRNSETDISPYKNI